MGWLSGLFRRGAKPSPEDQIPTVKPSPRRPVPVNPPWRKDYASNELWRAAVNEHNEKLANFRREEAMRLGIKRFRWKWSGGGPFKCSVAERLDGRVFDYDAPPNEGLPGSCICDHDYCRYCYAHNIIPGFE